jgi:uncharacterized protein
VARAVLLDTSAFLTWSQDEPGAEEVETYFQEAMDGRVALHASFVSLTEMEYITAQKLGPNKARELLESVEEQPVAWHHSDKALCSEAAKLKAAYKVSFADAFVAATAKRLDAVLVHKDPEFDALKGVMKLHPLPPKPGKTT